MTRVETTRLETTRLEELQDCFPQHSLGTIKDVINQVRTLHAS